jgi:hypothetical protein
MSDPEPPLDTTLADVAAEILDPRISKIFYFFERHTTLTTGRTVGRKIGVVQEFMLKKYLEADEDLNRRMYLEQLLTGRSGASHKVEFSWFWITPHLSQSAGDVLLDDLRIARIDTAAGSVAFDVGWKRPVSVKVGAPTPRSGVLREFLRERNSDLRITAVGPDVANIDVVDHSRLLASLESKRVGAQRFSSSDKLGSGIQTIEKAKQASLVAIDLDLQHNGNVKPLEEPDTEKNLLSVVALGNGVHWTTKDLQILGTYVDNTFLVRDDGIIRYLEFVRERVGTKDFLEEFLGYFAGMTKQPADDFEVFDEDFVAVVPPEEPRSLRELLAEHVLRVNPT